ncbi:MAG: type III secretion system export apparatus subunit SctR [Verrucomicrobiota bacterium]|nr:type III secretion system export apparatus subunit SctR [Verrucomicrobiota bacterium]
MARFGSCFSQLHKMKIIQLLFLFFVCLTPLAAAQPASSKSSNPERQELAVVPANPSVVTKMAVLAGIALLPFAVMLLTSFMKIVVVLSLFRQALGTQQTPPNQVLTGIALLITLYVMFPTGVAMYRAAQPAIEKTGAISMISDEAVVFVVDVVDKAKEPLRSFLQKNTEAAHMDSFYKLAYRIFPEPYKEELKRTDLLILIPAFVTSQLKNAFEVGVLIYLPFFVIDMVVSNILLAMGMMMLSPLTIALPIKLLLLVMVDGWTLLIQGLAGSFR